MPEDNFTEDFSKIDDIFKKFVEENPKIIQQQEEEKKQQE